MVQPFFASNSLLLSARGPPRLGASDEPFGLANVAVERDLEDRHYEASTAGRSARRYSTS